MNRTDHDRGFTLIELIVAFVCATVLFLAATEFLFALRSAAEQDTARFSRADRSARLLECVQEDLREAVSFFPGADGDGFVIEVPAVNSESRVVDGHDAICYFRDRASDDQIHRTVIPCVASARRESKTRIANCVKQFSVTVSPARLAKIELRVSTETQRGDMSQLYGALVLMRNYQKVEK